MFTVFPLTEEAIATAKASDAVLMGSIGGDAKTSPWYKLEPSSVRKQDFLPSVRH